ncbi:hypothetical protein ANANG_G00120890 [Anguilla anguilla]|uniref:Nudix hydrolase domain-containing protein n=1 Tax=Anguilla anguilla TaxID=7936 RepID=A0A9D3MDG9_ANGAN|nr:hypothetical protein ANANG_G00120890 [Anguilla anguilla]
MDQINNIQVVPCTSSNHLKPFRVHYSQNGTKKSWDFMRTHESVSILIFNTTSHCFVLVKQFRPAVYVCEWEKSKPKQAEEEKKKEGEEVAPEEQTEKQPAEVAEGEGQGTGAETGETGSAPDLPRPRRGHVRALRRPGGQARPPSGGGRPAGVLQECGYDVPVAKLRKITSYRSGVGVTGAKQTLFYAEVSEENHVGVAVAEGEAELREGEVVKVPLHEAMTFAYDESIPKTMAVIFSFVWFHNNMSPKYKISTNV